MVKPVAFPMPVPCSINCIFGFFIPTHQLVGYISIVCANDVSDARKIIGIKKMIFFMVNDFLRWLLGNGIWVGRPLGAAHP